MKNTFRNERTMLDISFLYYLASYHHIIFFSEGTIHLLDAQASLPSFLLYVLDISLILIMPNIIRFQNWIHNLFIYHTQKNQQKTLYEIRSDDGSDKYNCF